MVELPDRNLLRCGQLGGAFGERDRGRPQLPLAAAISASSARRWRNVCVPTAREDSRRRRTRRATPPQRLPLFRRIQGFRRGYQNDFSDLYYRSPAASANHGPVRRDGEKLQSEKIGSTAFVNVTVLTKHQDRLTS